MKRALILIALAGLTAVLAAPAMAGTHDNAVVALHIQARAKKPTLICFEESPNAKGVACSQFTLTGGLDTAYDVYLMIARGDSTTNGLAGLSCGIRYNESVSMFGWELCSDLEFPNGGWPNSEAGNRITWSPLSNCQRTEVGDEGTQTAAGAFYVFAYGAGNMFITKNENLVIPELAVADCNAAETQLEVTRGGIVAFGDASVAPCNPCLMECMGVPVEPTTWGKLKTKY